MTCHILLLILCLTLALANPEYYRGIDSSRPSFKTDLHNLIQKSKNIGYSAVWAAFLKTDTRNTAPCGDNIGDIYSSFCWKPIVQQCGTFQREGQCYNREHSWPKSWWGGSSSIPAYADVHHLFPTDGYVNGKRSNLPFDEVVAPISYTSTNGGRVGKCRSGVASHCFEPNNEFKGDLARTMFYMSIRYDGVFQCCDNESVNKAQMKKWMQDLMRKWHVQDPVSPKEKKRNDEIFVLQMNRNPFIDHPEWVSVLFK